MTKFTLKVDDAFLEDYKAWEKDNNIKILKKIDQLIISMESQPYEGLGKPKPLRNQLSGFWSRRINREHRLVYRVDEEREEIIIIQCRHHY
jgi:toxin YoeB